MKMLAIFYMVCTCIDWIMFVGGEAALNNKDILCYDNSIMLVNSNMGSFYMLFFSLSCYFYAFFMWYTFYQVPKKFGVVSRRSVDDVAMLGDESAIIHDEENLKAVVRELDNDRRFIKQQQNKKFQKDSNSDHGSHIHINSTLSPTNTEVNVEY